MAALRELLLAAERAPQPLDDAILSFARSLLLYPPATDPSPPIPPSQDDASSLSRQFLAIHPQGELFLRVWPENHGTGSRYEKRDSFATFLHVVTHLLQVQQQLDAAQAEAFALRVVREKMVQLEKLLSWSDKPWIEFRVLELMTAVTKVSTVTAREFVRVFNFQCPAFVKLATRRWKKSEEDGHDKTIEKHAPVQLRAVYVDLVLALTACPDKSVHRFAMKEGGVTASLFKSVDGDSIEMLTTLFTRLGKTVLYNDDVERKSKLVVYNGTCVHQVLALLHVEGDASVRDMALGVLNALFFEDSALYVVPQKQALRLFLSKTTSAQSDEETITSEEAYAVKVIRNAVATIGVNELLRSAQAQALVMQFLAEYPGFLSEYLAALSLQLEPKPVFRWFCVASIVQKLLSCSLDAMAVGMPMNENQDALQSWCSPQILASRLIAPGNFRKELSRGIQHNSNLVVYSSLCVIEAMLNRFVRVASLLPSPGFASEVCSELRFLLPSPEALVSLLLKLCASQQRSVALVYVRALTVFRLYMECLPQSMREIKVDFTKMLTWHYLDCPVDNSAEGVVLTTPLQSLIISEILRFLLAIDTSRLRFLFTSGSSDHRSKLQQMLLLYVSASSLSVQELACQVLRRTLRASDIFGLTTQGEEGRDIAGLANDEISFWLESLCQGGGKVCALFTEQLVCVVMADPFKYVAIGSRVVTAASSSSSLSPITVALVEFLSSRSGVAGSSDLSAYRANKCVVAFAVRILLALMPTSKHPQQLVALIASNDAFADMVIAPKMHQNEDDNTCNNNVKNKKRKRSDEIICDEGDAYMWLKMTCDALVSETCKSNNVASPRKGTKIAGTKWHRHSDVNMLTAALVEMTPSSFVTSWDHIVSNCAEVAANFSPIVHYLSGRGDVDILSLLSRPVTQLVTISKDRRQRQTSDSSSAETFTKIVPLYIVLQHVLFRTSNQDCEDQDSTIAVMMSVVKSRVENNLLAATDAARMCEQLLFFFALRNHGFSENGYSRLCELFSNLLTICIVHGENGLTSDIVSRIFFKLQAVISSNASSSSWRQLYAVKIVALRVYSSINPDSNLATLCDFGDLFQRAGVPLVAVLASRVPPSSRIAVLYSLLQHSSARIITTAPHTVLVECVLKSLRNRGMGKHFRSIIVHKRTKLLKQKLWLLLCSESSQQKLPFLMDGFTVLGQLGGVDASTVLPFIATSLVPLVVQSALATSSRNHCTEIMKAMIAALRSGEEVAAFPVIFEEQLWKQIQHGMDQRVVCRLVGALYDVFARVVHPELRQLSDDLIPACYQRVLLKSHEGCTAELALVRHLCTDASSSGNASAFRASLGAALQELASSQCNDTLSSSQLLALLFLSRSSGFDDSNAVDLLAILIRSGVGSLKAAQTKLDQLSESECDSLPHDFEATMLLVGSVIGYLQHQVPEKLSSALKLVFPLFATMCEGVRESTSKLAFVEFVDLTAALLRIAGNDTNAIDYDFVAHFDAIVQHPCFTTSLQNGENKEVQLLIAQVVAQLVRITGKYTRPLLQILLASYSMSLSPFDRSLRVLFEEFEAQEKDGLTLASMGFRFGASSTILPAAAMPVSSKRSHNDLVDDSAWVLGGGLEQDRVRATIERFPLTRTISTTSDTYLLNLNKGFFAGDTSDEAAQALVVDGGQPIEGYDPAFLLPMLSHFISSSDLPDGGIVQQGLLGVAIRATSSDVEDMRKYAFGILAHVHESLQASSETSSDFKAGRQVHLLLDVFRRGIAEELKQVPSLVTVFLNDALAVLTRPTHVLYPQVNHFLLARPAMDVADVPMFYSLFNSRAPLTFRQERSWLLHTLRRGIRADDDVVLLVRRHVLPMLLSFYTSELADTHTQPLITNILIATLDTPSGGVHLVTKTALLEWLAAQFLRYGAVSLSTKCRGDKSIGSTTRPASSALLLPLMMVFEQALRDGIWNALDVTYQRAAALQAANTFACLHTAIVGTKIDRSASSKAAAIATLVVRRAGHVCSLELLLGAVGVVQQKSAKSEQSACMELAEIVASNLTRWLLQRHHFEAQKQRFQDWALLLRQVASMLVSCGENGVLTKQQRARCSLDQIKSVLDQLPTLKQLVVAPETTNDPSVSTPALF